VRVRVRVRVRVGVRLGVRVRSSSSPSASMPAGESGMMVRIDGTELIIETKEVYMSSMRSTSPA